MHTLSLEFSSQFSEYLKQVEDQIKKIKAESITKLKKKVVYGSGIDFLGSTVQDKHDKHPDDFLRQGVQDFKRRSEQIEIKELNLDPKIIEQQKEQLLKQQAKKEQEEAKQKEVLTEETKTKKKKNKKKKNKGLAAFMDDDDESKAFKED